MLPRCQEYEDSMKCPWWLECVAAEYSIADHPRTGLGYWSQRRFWRASELTIRELVCRAGAPATEATMLASFMVAAEPRYACSPAVAPGEVVPLTSRAERRANRRHLAHSFPAQTFARAPRSPPDSLLSP